MVPAGAWALPPVGLLALVFLYPLALVVQQSVRPDSGGTSVQPYADVFASEAFREALWTTVWLAAASTAGCLVLGFVLALIIAFVPFPGARSVSRFIDVFLSFPSFLITLALLFIYGSTDMANGLWSDVTGAGEGPFQFLTTPWGVLLAEITYFTPFVMRPLLAANEFGIVLFTGAKGVTTLPMLVYGKAILESDYPGACVVAVVNVLISVGLYGLYRVVSRRAGA